MSGRLVAVGFVAAAFGAGVALVGPLSATAVDYEESFMNECVRGASSWGPDSSLGDPGRFCAAEYVEVVCPDADSAADVELECLPGLEPSGAAVALWREYRAR